jgi:predicted ATPase/DNA-binding CsgD family transcriptional regulator
MSSTAVALGALLERDEFLRSLQVAHEEVRAGRGRVLFVTGEAGGGKTALLRHFCDELAPTTRVLWGACEPLFTARPLGPILDVVHEAGLELRETVEGDAVPYQVAVSLIRELQRNGPTILVLEDVHWADEATLDVLRFLLGRAESLPVLLVSTYRDEDVSPSHPLTLVLGETTSGLMAPRLRLPPLSPAAVAELAGPFGLDPDALCRATSGNPFFVTEVLASPGTEIPETVRDAVLARAARLYPEARRVLEAVAVSSPKAEIWLVEALSGQTDHRLDECVGSGMLEVDEGTVAFRHELARAAIEGSLAPGRRLGLHRKALAALLERSEDTDIVARLAHHAEAAHDEEAVRTFARAAGDQASARGAHREAAEQYARALRFSTSVAPDEVAELLRLRSGECYLTDQAEEAIDALRKAVECYRAIGDRAAEGETLARLSTILWCPGRGPEARKIGHEAVALLEQGPRGRELALAYMNLAFLGRMAADGESAREWNSRALELARNVDDAHTLCLALISDGETRLFSDRAAARRTLEEAMALANEIGAGDLLAYALYGLAFSASSSEEADTILDNGLAHCSETGNDLMRLYFLALRAQQELERGLWSEAADSASMILRERVVSTFPRTMALVVLALVRARRGDPDALPLLAEAHTLAEPTGELPRIAPVAAAQAEFAWLRRDIEMIREVTGSALELARQRRSAWTAGELLVWRRRAGIHDDLDGLPVPPYALTLAGDPELAAAAWAKRGRPYEAALALADADSEAVLRRALDELNALGARPAAAIVARRLRELGARGLPRGPRESTRANAAQLTARELDVLGLLAEGHRNAEIAECLVVSRRTVDYHVSSILRKLDAHTRGEAVAEARRLGLIQDR